MWKDIKNKIFKKEPQVDYLVVGLGNPGEKYEKTAHNVGFRVASLFQEKHNLPSFEKDNTLKSFISKGLVENKKIALLLPQTYINLSGDAVKRAVKNLGVVLENIIVIQDDTDLPLGVVRFSFNRNSAGHNGISSIIKSLGGKNFYRLRVGVREKEGKSITMILKNNSDKTKKVEELAVEELFLAIKNNPQIKTTELKQKNEE